MRNLFLKSIVVVFAFFNLKACAEDDQLIFWGKPVQEWSLGISTTNTIFPEAVPPVISLYLSNGSTVARTLLVDGYHQQIAVVWMSDSGETLEQTHPPIRSLHSLGRTRVLPELGPGGVRSAGVASEDILARQPPGRGTLIVSISMGTGDDGNKLHLYSGELELKVRSRNATDPPRIPLTEWIVSEHDGNKYRMVAPIRVVRESTDSNSFVNVSAIPPTPHIPSPLNKSGTPSIGEKSGTSASPVIATISASDSTVSIFTPRNIIGATVVLGLLAIIASVLVRARSRQNSPP